MVLHTPNSHYIKICLLDMFTKVNYCNDFGLNFRNYDLVAGGNTTVTLRNPTFLCLKPLHSAIKDQNDFVACI